MAKGLLSLGLAPGDHLAVWAPNRPEWVLLQFVAARVGIVLVTINPAYQAEELAYTLRQSETQVLVLVDQIRGSDCLALLEAAIPDWRMVVPGKQPSEKAPALRWVVGLSGAAGPGVLSWEALLAQGEGISDTTLVTRERELTAGDPINIQYTSGTTGAPEGAMLPHRNLLLNAYYVGQRQRLNAGDRICIPVPLYHCFGCVLGSLCAVVHGATMVFPHDSFDPGKTLAAVEQERCTVLYGVPTMFIAQLEHEGFPERDLTSLRTGIMAGSPCPRALMERVTEVMGCRELTIAYGQTEASPVITQTGCDDSIEIRVGTVGKPLYRGLRSKSWMWRLVRLCPPDSRVSSVRVAMG